jgi:oligopeptidase A
MAGSATLRQVHLALTDLRLHSEWSPDCGETPEQLRRRIATTTTVLAPIDADAFLCSFGHIFAGGYAALTLAPVWHDVTTVEYKINFLAAFQDGELRARGLVIRAGKKLIVTTAEVVHLDADGKESPCALMQQTIAVVQKRY